MNTDGRYERIKILIKEEHITELQEVFIDCTMSVVADDIGIKYQRLLYILKKPKSIKVDDIEKIARLLNIEDTRIIYNLIANQLENVSMPKKK
jgi:hypothetical protein